MFTRLVVFPVVDNLYFNKETQMKMLLGASVFTLGLFIAFSIGDLNAHWTLQNICAGVTGGLIASVGLVWSLN